MKRLLIVGAGGHAKVVIEAIQAARLGDIVGLVAPAPLGSRVLGIPVIGSEADLERLLGEGVTAAVVALGANTPRLNMGRQLEALGYDLPAIIHPSALISPSARIDRGAVIMARAVVGTETLVGSLAIVNTSASVDHDNVIGIAAHVAPGCALAGNVSVGERALVGVGSAVRPGIKIGVNAVVGAGSAVVADVADDAVVGGAPAKVLASR